MTKNLVTILLLTALGLGAAAFVVSRTGRVDVAMLIIPIVFIGGTLIGLVPLEFIAAIAAFSILILGYVFFYRST